MKNIIEKIEVIFEEPKFCDEVKFNEIEWFNGTAIKALLYSEGLKISECVFEFVENLPRLHESTHNTNYISDEHFYFFVATVLKAMRVHIESED